MQRLYQAIINSDPWLAALVVGCLTVAVACIVFSQETTEFPPDKTVITFCRGGYKRDREQMREIKAAFERKHQDLHLNIIRSNVQRKADTMIAAGVAPDLLFVPCDTVDYYIQAGALRDLTPYIEQDPELRRAFGRTLFDDADADEPDFIEPLVTPFVREVDGRKRLYAVPISYTPFFVYYSKDLFDRYNVPYPDENWDWGDLQEKAVALTRDINGRRPDQPGFDETRVATYGFNLATWQHGVEGFIRQNGGRLVSEDGTKVVADNPRTVDALQFLYDLKWKHHVIPTGEGANARNIAFDKGTVGMLLWGSFYVSTLNDQAQELDWDVAPMPRGPGGKRASVIFANGWGITVDSKVPDKAFEYLRFLVSDEGMRIASKHAVFLPTRRSMLRVGGLVDTTGKPASRWALTHDVDAGYAMAPYSTTQFYGDVYDVINENLDKLLVSVNPPFDAQGACERMTHYGNIVLSRDRAVHGSHSFGVLALLVAVVPLAYLAYRLLRRPGRGLSSLDRREERWGYLLISPWLLGFTLFAAFPILVSIMLSFSQWQSLSDFTQAEFIGFENYRVALSGDDPKFWTSLWVTFRYALLAVPAGLFAGLALAILMNQPVRGISIFRTLYYIPAVLPSVAAAILWWHLFDKNYGWVNRVLAWLNPASVAQLMAVPIGIIALLLIGRILRRLSDNPWWRRVVYLVPTVLCGVALAVGAWLLLSPQQTWMASLAGAATSSDEAAAGTSWLFGSGWITRIAHAIGAQYPVAWLSDSKVTPYIFVVMALWAVGGGMIIYLAGLQGIPTQLYEAAEIDGAGRWRKLRNVTIPMLSPVIFFNLIMGVIGSFQVFNTAFVLFDGHTGPDDSALFYGLHLFREAFFKYRLGYASALAWILFSIILLFTAMIFKSSPMWVYYESAKGRRK